MTTSVLSKRSYKAISQNNHVVEPNYPKILMSLGDISDVISSYVNQYCNGKDNDLMKNLNELMHKIPKINVWGQQKAGKTSVLNKTYDLDLKVDALLATKCPTEIRFSPLYKKKQYIAINWRSNQKHVFNSYIEVEKAVDNIEPKNSLKYYWKIIIETPCDETDEAFCIVDLPGYVKGHDEYFNWLKDQYLHKEETVIIHIIRADTDPDNEHADDFLKNVTNKIITVCTHTDSLIGDQPKMKFIHKHLSSTNDVAFVVTRENSNEDDENNVLNNFFNLDIVKNASNNNIIRGTKNTKKIIKNFLKHKVIMMLPQFKIVSNNISSGIKEQFDLIGRKELDQRDDCRQFKSMVRKNIKNEFSDNSNLFIELNQHNIDIAANKIESFISLLPNESLLAKELDSGIRITVKDSGGWDILIKKYVKIMIEETKNNIIDKYVEIFFHIFIQHINKLFDPTNYKPSAVTPCSDMIKSSIDAIYEVKSKAMVHFNELYRNYEIPYSSEAQFNKQFITNIVKKTLDKAYKGFNEKRSKSEMELIILNDYNERINTMSASCAHSHITIFWTKESVKLHDDLMKYTMRCQIDIYNKIESNIELIEHEKFIEPESSRQRRILLCEMENKFKEFSELL